MRIIYNQQPIWVCDFCERAMNEVALMLASYTQAAICKDCIQAPYGLWLQPRSAEPEPSTDGSLERTDKETR
jgi:hypothetical protein